MSCPLEEGSLIFQNFKPYRTPYNASRERMPNSTKAYSIPELKTEIPRTAYDSLVNDQMFSITDFRLARVMGLPRYPYTCS